MKLYSRDSNSYTAKMLVGLKCEGENVAIAQAAKLKSVSWIDEKNRRHRKSDIMQLFYYAKAPLCLYLAIFSFSENKMKPRHN